MPSPNAKDRGHDACFVLRGETRVLFGPVLFAAGFGIRFRF